MDIVARLQSLPVGRFHYKLLVLVGLGWLFDAMDTGMVPKDPFTRVPEDTTVLLWSVKVKTAPCQPLPAASY